MQGDSGPPAGRPGAESQASELRYWELEGVRQFDVHLKFYRRLFPIEQLDYRATSILDVGSGAVSVFEAVAPADARIVPYDTLASAFNRIAPHKKFQIHGRMPSGEFDLITLLNCIDHMHAPGELLADVSRRLAPCGELWIYSHVDRPFDALTHPQKFRFWQLIVLANRFLTVRSCGLIREGRLFPYAWWGVCRRRDSAPRVVSHVRALVLVAKCAAQYGWFHGVRAAVKAVKLLGFRRLLPRELRF